MRKRMQPPERTVKQLIELWMDSRKRWKRSTRTGYGSYVKHVTPLWNVPITKLTPLAIDEWLSAMIENHGLRTVQVAGNVLRAALKYAVVMGLLNESPFRSHVPCPPRKRIVPFTDAEVRRILLASQSDRLGGVIVVAFLCGMRQGEIFGLQWGDIDWETGRLSIERQAVECRGKVHVDVPKTEAGVRTLLSCAFVMDTLRRRLDVAQLEEFAGPTDFVFPLANGRPGHRTNFGHRTWGPLLKRLGIAHRGLHHGRHSFASMLIRDGVPHTEAAASLGHTSGAFTLSRYCHALEGHGEATKQAMERFVEKAIGASQRPPGVLGDISDVELVPEGEEAVSYADGEKRTMNPFSGPEDTKPSPDLPWADEPVPQNVYSWVPREVLYAQAWRVPMCHLAKRYDISDVGLRNTCHRHLIPVPTIGQWAKMQHGHPVDRPPLPPILDGSVGAMVRIRSQITVTGPVHHSASEVVPHPVAA